MPVTPQAVGYLEPGDTTPSTHLLVVTADLDYPRLLALLKLERPGVIVFRGGSDSDTEMLALFDRVLAQIEPLKLESSITVVDQARDSAPKPLGHERSSTADELPPKASELVSKDT
jgi:hypothetical protein